MITGVRSQQVRTASELTLMARIKPGFVEGMVEPLTYASRLRTLLSTLFRLRKAAEEQHATQYVGPLERLRALHFVRYAIFDDDRRLLLAVSFDHSWESYMRGLVDNAGPLLDAIFCHCTDYAGSSCSRGFAAFTSWVKAHQIPVDFFFAAEPTLTTDDLRYLKKYAKLKVDATFEADAANLRVGDYDARQDGEKDPNRALKLLAVLKRLGALFPDLGGAPHSDKAFFEGTARSLLWGSGPVLDALQPKVPSGGALHELMQWYAELQRAAAQAPSLGRSEPDRAHIQGNVLSAYEDMTHACLVLIQCDDAAAMAGLFGTLQDDIAYDGAHDTRPVKVNVAVTARGLKTRGLSNTEQAAFPAEFQEGMEARAGLLGDVAGHHPDNWQRPTLNWPLGVDGLPIDSETAEPIPLSTIDVVVLLHTHHAGVEGDHLLVQEHPLRERVAGLEMRGVRILRVETMRRIPKPPPKATQLFEEFGFRDGISQPTVPARDAVETADDVAPGELVMGYPDARGEVQRHDPRAAESADLFKDGTFLVIRKLGQDVAAFEQLEKDSAKALGVDDPAVAGAKIMGRDRHGVSLMHSSNGENAFDYASDPNGETCPFHAHIRRANPRRAAVEASGLRNSNPRIARRGLPYRAGPKAEERGLLFMAYNARIAEQYEVIQGWLHGANPTGLPSSSNDFLTGLAHGDRPPYRVWVNGSVKQLPLPAESPVTLKWGMYLFVPGRHVIARFAAPAGAASQPSGAADDARALLEAGEQLIAALGRLPADQARFEWKRVLENPALPQRRAARAAWVAIRKRGGALATPYGLLVGDAAEVERVLSDHATFSVREYYDRMRTSVGPLHLGMDPDVYPIARSRPEHLYRDQVYERDVGPGRYHAESTYNREMAGIDKATAFEAAHTATVAWLDALIQELAAFAGMQLAPPADPETRWVPIQVDLRRLAFDVIEALAKKWFELPPDLRDDFWTISLDSFRPNPEPWVREGARRMGPEIARKYREHFEGDERKASERIAAVLGFTGPTTGSFMAVMNVWDSLDQLGRIKQWWDRQTTPFKPDDPSTALYGWLIEAMQSTPVPDLLHRTALKDCVVGGEQVAAGDRVVVSLASASAQCPQRRDLLFGGDYGNSRKLTHACPGQNLALGVLLGMISALLERARPHFVATLMLEISVAMQPRRPAPSATRRSV